MGQKVNPIGFRLAVTKDWRSRWFGRKKDFASKIAEDFQVRELVRERPGAGLGLALVAEIAAAHGGSAAVESRDGGGSVFVLDLGPIDGGPPAAEIAAT